MQTSSITIPVYNLGCGGSEALIIERALSHTPGVAHVYVNPATELAYVDYDSALASPEQLQAIINDLGYAAPPLPAAR